MEQNEAAITKQELFDRVATHLFTQRKRAAGEAVGEVDGVLGCRYRTQDGLSCAIGCLIPDDLYDPRWEGVGVTSSRGGPIRQAVGLTENTLLLAEDLQDTHDWNPYWSTPQAMLARLRGVVDFYGLSDAVLTPELVGGETW